MYEIEGELVHIGGVQTFSSGFTKREFVIETKGPGQKYDNPVKFSFKKDNCGLLEGFSLGQRVKVRFAVDGRRWDGPKGTQYFVDLTGIGIESVGGASGTRDVRSDEGETEDLPF